MFAEFLFRMMMISKAKSLVHLIEVHFYLVFYFGQNMLEILLNDDLYTEKGALSMSVILVGDKTWC